MTIDVNGWVAVTIVTVTVATITANTAWLQQQLDLLKRSIMATFDDVKVELDAIKDGVATVLAKAQAQSDQIAALQAQIAAGTPVSQAQLDSLKAEEDQIIAALTPASS